MLKGIERVAGSPFQDWFFGDDKRNVLWGFDGDDKLDGRGGNDVLNGGRGSDSLKGGPGNDRLSGGPGGDQLDGGTGDDVLTGGAGSDVFEFNGNPGAAAQGDDRITDFMAGKDQIEIYVGAGDGDVVVEIVGSDTVITYANGTITLEGVMLSEEQIDISIPGL